MTTKYHVEIDGQYGEPDGAVRIMDSMTYQEVLIWDSAEWIEDPSLVFVIANAIDTALNDPEKFTSRLEQLRRNH